MKEKEIKGHGPGPTFATDVTRSVVCVSVCLTVCVCVGYTDFECRNG